MDSHKNGGRDGQRVALQARVLDQKTLDGVRRFRPTAPVTFAHQPLLAEAVDEELQPAGRQGLS